MGAGKKKSDRGVRDTSPKKVYRYLFDIWAADPCDVLHLMVGRANSAKGSVVREIVEYQKSKFPQASTTKSGGPWNDVFLRPSDWSWAERFMDHAKEVGADHVFQRVEGLEVMLYHPPPPRVVSVLEYEPAVRALEIVRKVGSLDLSDAEYKRRRRGLIRQFLAALFGTSPGALRKRDPAMAWIEEENLWEEPKIDVSMEEEVRRIVQLISERKAKEEREEKEALYEKLTELAREAGFARAHGDRLDHLVALADYVSKERGAPVTYRDVLLEFAVKVLRETESRTEAEFKHAYLHALDRLWVRAAEGGLFRSG